MLSIYNPPPLLTTPPFNSSLIPNQHNMQPQQQFDQHQTQFIHNQNRHPDTTQIQFSQGNGSIPKQQNSFQFQINSQSQQIPSQQIPSQQIPNQQSNTAIAEKVTDDEITEFLKDL